VLILSPTLQIVGLLRYFYVQPMNYEKRKLDTRLK